MLKFVGLKKPPAITKTATTKVKKQKLKDKK